MKAWFARFSISAALDGVQRPAARSQQTTSAADELHDFEQEMTALDRALKRTAPRPEAPASLHGSIMRTVQAARQPVPAERGARDVLRWLGVPAGAALVLVAAWYVARGPVKLPARETQSLAAATAALEMGGQMARTVPSAVVTPLADELEKVNRDLNYTAQFILANLP